MELVFSSEIPCCAASSSSIVCGSPEMVNHHNEIGKLTRKYIQLQNASGVSANELDWDGRVKSSQAAHINISLLVDQLQNNSKLSHTLASIEP